MHYLTLQDALYIHREQLRLFGGASGIRDAGLIEAALLRPQTGYYSGVIEEAAALWESLAMNHGFIDGNKRVAFACVDIFLELNGHQLQAEQDAVINFIYGHLQAGTFRKDAVQQWLMENTVPHR
ncbi:type II toxin-antitoxin system death-on-curing family toxin [Oricola sp.]|uniref:type II toxin-antitoxin system death-on-curing family toxin n=1 Tax=Oricola sp. TaxID=1979950 RepID=UPI0025CEC997|nr:type II toxin-antitoxin system death-on-curing family toxin [Oricola sp.]MCI5077840.1 type II toxin-antitoxin system death-on-curing family toxin [Oricola sp.]